MRIRHLILILSLVMGAAATGWAVADSVEGRIYPMTAAEVEEVVTQWLKNNGFEVFNQSQSDQRIDLLAERYQQKIRIEGQSHTPLAARIQIEPLGKASQSAAGALQNYLDGYIKSPDKQPGRDSNNIPTLVRRHHKAVVCLYVAASTEKIQVTGFIVDKHGLVLCTGHDLALHEQVGMLLSDGREITGRVIKIDRRRDLALIQAETMFDSSISLQNGRFMLQDSDRLFAITCPNGGIVTFEPGTLDGPPRRVEGMPLWQVNMHVTHGSSGSPVFDSQGRMAAVVKGRFRGTDSVGFLIPFEIILQFLEKY